MSDHPTTPTTERDVLTQDDHARGCAGREYECTCGYDSRVFDEIARLRLKLSNIANADPKPFYRQDDKMFLARKVLEEDMACWEGSATASIRFMRPGGINWPMIVRSLIAEVRGLRAEIDRGRDRFLRENGGI